MYEEYFGLKKKPFSIVPDPTCFYMSEGHREALAHLLFGTTGEGGFVLLTGEVGTGKTTVCRRFLEMVPEGTEVAFILNPKLTASELLATICDEFGIAYLGGTTSVKTLVDAINDYLLGVHDKGRRAVLIVEEAQNLSIEVLEQIRLLTNLETRQQKLLQMIMIGQPELRDMLAKPQLSQLSQRITARYHLGPLSRREIPAYIDYRLTRAGLAKMRLFTPAALRMIYRLTKGVPRLINIICDRAMLGAFAEGKERVDASTMRKAAREAVGTRRRAWVVPVAAGAFLILLLAGGAFCYLQAISNWRYVYPWQTRYRVVEAAPAPVKTAVGPKGADKQKKEPEVAKLSPAGLEIPEGQSAGATQAAAYAELFRAWGISYDGTDSRRPCDQAHSQGLACLSGKGSIATLREMNRPAFLTLVDDQKVEYYATLTALKGETATVAIGGETRRTDTGQIARRWSGNYLVLWREPPGYKGELKRGARGSQVAWLERQLAVAAGQRPPAGADSVYDEALERQVRAFQIASDIMPNGIAGPRTIMRLSGTAPDNRDPVLAEKGTR